MKPTHRYHRFLDEAGDTTFYGKGRIPIIGTNGVSQSFSIGMVTFNEPLASVRERIVDLQSKVVTNPLYRNVPSIQKRVVNGGFYFHAKEDLPELRKDFFDLIRSIDCCLQMVVGRKEITRYVNKHNGKEPEFYADLLSHLIKDNFEEHSRMVLNIAQRDSSTSLNNLNQSLHKAKTRFHATSPVKQDLCEIVFNVQKFTDEPLLAVADYLCWTVQRIFERGETRFYDYMIANIPLVIDLYDKDNFENGRNYYTVDNPLTAKNELSPQ